MKILEDNLQYIIAKKENCKVIITNDKKFKFNEIEILNSTQFVKKYLKG